MVECGRGLLAIAGAPFRQVAGHRIPWSLRVALRAPGRLMRSPRASPVHGVCQ